MKAILVIDICDKEIPKEKVTAIKLNDGEMIDCDTKLISMDDYINYTFPIMYEKLLGHFAEEMVGEEE